MKKIKTMNDWTTGVLSISGRYYVRHMYKWKSYTSKPKLGFKWDRIEYYSLRWQYLPLAMAECENCGEIVQSQYCWHFTSCSCGRTKVDTGRNLPESHRFLTK